MLSRSSSQKGITYDAGGSIATTLPTILYSYDAAGNLIGESDPNGMITAYTYNDLNELTDELVTQAIDQGTGVHRAAGNGDN